MTAKVSACQRTFSGWVSSAAFCVTTVTSRGLTPSQRAGACRLTFGSGIASRTVNVDATSTVRSAVTTRATTFTGAASPWVRPAAKPKRRVFVASNSSRPSRTSHQVTWRAPGALNVSVWRPPSGTSATAGVRLGAPAPAGDRMPCSVCCGRWFAWLSLAQAAERATFDTRTSSTSPTYS